MSSETGVVSLSFPRSRAAACHSVSDSWLPLPFCTSHSHIPLLQPTLSNISPLSHTSPSHTMASAAVAGRTFVRSLTSQSFARCARPQMLSLRAPASRSFAVSARGMQGEANGRMAESMLTLSTAFEKKYTQDHEWVELSSDNKTGNALPLPTPRRHV